MAHVQSGTSFGGRPKARQGEPRFRVQGLGFRVDESTFDKLVPLKRRPTRFSSP